MYVILPFPVAMKTTASFPKNETHQRTSALPARSVILQSGWLLPEPALITDYATYSSLDGLYTGNSTYDAVLDQVESDFKEAMELLPSRDQGGEWEKDVPPVVPQPVTMPVRSWYAINSKTPLLY